MGHLDGDGDVDSVEGRSCRTVADSLQSCDVGQHRVARDREGSHRRLQVLHARRERASRQLLESVSLLGLSFGRSHIALHSGYDIIPASIPGSSHVSCTLCILHTLGDELLNVQPGAHIAPCRRRWSHLQAGEAAQNRIALDGHRGAIHHQCREAALEAAQQRVAGDL